jgi:small subunit ribosomal protein S14
MARKASIEKNNKRINLSKKYFSYRAQLRADAIDMKKTEVERNLARTKLQDLSANNSHTRVRSRCLVTGRPRGNYRKFGLSRLTFRQLALAGKIPGMTKASW